MSEVALDEDDARTLIELLESLPTPVRSVRLWLDRGTWRATVEQVESVLHFGEAADPSGALLDALSRAGQDPSP